MKYISRKDLVVLSRGKRKGDNGRVLIVGGSSSYVGAVALAGLAALRSGVDWVSVMAPSKVGWAINSLTADLVVKKVKGEYFDRRHVREVLREECRYDVVLLGNGIGLKFSLL